MTQVDAPSKPFVFPKWANKLPLLCAAGAIGALGGAIFVIGYYFSPQNTDVGYQPDQPIEYSHKLHAGDLGIDCRYCHTSVEKSAVASLPTSQTCMNCHAQVKKDSPKLALLRELHEKNLPIPWVRVHKVPDYVYFQHDRHVAQGVSCVECHGRIDQMIQVKQTKPLSMGWCLDCHREPAAHLRPVSEITNLAWEPPAPETAESVGKKILQEKQDAGMPITPPTYCTGCHR